jgi:hypothetical protein
MPNLTTDKAKKNRTSITEAINFQGNSHNPTCLRDDSSRLRQAFSFDIDVGLAGGPIPCNVQSSPSRQQTGKLKKLSKDTIVMAIRAPVSCCCRSISGKFWNAEISSIKSGASSSIRSEAACGRQQYARGLPAFYAVTSVPYLILSQLR